MNSTGKAQIGLGIFRIDQNFHIRQLRTFQFEILRIVFRHCVALRKADQHEQTRQQWVETRSHSQAIDKVVDRYRQQEHQERDRMEQREQDERAQRSGKK